MRRDRGPPFRHPYFRPGVTSADPFGLALLMIRTPYISNRPISGPHFLCVVCLLFVCSLVFVCVGFAAKPVRTFYQNGLKIGDFLFLFDARLLQIPPLMLCRGLWVPFFRSCHNVDIPTVMARARSRGKSLLAVLANGAYHFKRIDIRMISLRSPLLTDSGHWHGQNHSSSTSMVQSGATRTPSLGPAESAF